MADRSPPRQQIQVQPPQYSRDAAGEYRTSKTGPSASQILAVVALLPVGGTLLAFAGIIFVGSMIGLVVATPLFVICSPVIVPAIATIGFAVTGFLSSGAFGLTGLSSLSWLLNYFKQAKESIPEQMEQAKKGPVASWLCRPKDLRPKKLEELEKAGPEDEGHMWALK